MTFSILAGVTPECQDHLIMEISCSDTEHCHYELTAEAAVHPPPALSWVNDKHCARAFQGK